MFHPFSTWWRALGVVLLSLATVPWPSAAQASTTPTFKVLHQDVVAALSTSGRAHFNVTLGLHPGDPKSRARVAIYPRLIERSQIDPIVSGVGVRGPATAVSGTFGLNCGAKGPVTITIDLYTTRPGPLRNHCAAVAPQLHLACRGQRCDGVYPLRISVTTQGVTTNKWSLLVLQATRVAQPVKVDLIETLDPSSWTHARRTISVLSAIGHYSSPITLSADYRTLSDLSGASALSTTLRGSLIKALSSPLHQVVGAPPGTIDFAGLSANGLASQVREQLVLSSNLLKTLTGRYVDGPVLLSGTPSLADVIALRRSGISEVVLPESALTTTPSSTLTWGAPFHPQGDASSNALSVDGPLSRLVTDSSIEPGLRAALTLATLDFLHFEAPYASAVRTVVLVAPVSQTPVLFVTDLLSGFRHNPFVQLATLSPSFDSALLATNGSPAERTLRSPKSPSTWSAHNVSSLTTLIDGVASYSQAVTSSNVGNDLRVAVASAEIAGSPDTRQAAINRASDALASQLSNFRVDPSTITLAGPSTSLPITLFSRANYTVTVVVHLVTDRLSFPKGKSVVVVLDSPTKSVRILTAKHLASSLTLQVVVTTPDNQTVLARAAIQVRIAGTSIVGYFLTLASLLVLAYWWLRTYRRKPKGRHAR